MPDINSFKKNGVSYFQLYIKCPVCNEQGRNVTPGYWTHAVDDGDIYIGENAFYYCNKCGCTEHVMKWRYRCPDHSTDADNEEDKYVECTDKSAYADVVAAAGQLVRAAGIPWLTELLKNL